MVHDYYSPVAVVEIDQHGYLLDVNQAAIVLFSLPNELINTANRAQFKFDYYRYLNLDSAIAIQQVESARVVIAQQYYFLQVLHDVNRILFVIQPVEYLKKRLANRGVANQQAFAIFSSNSLSMQKLIQQAKAFSVQNEPLLISGETGTGKDLLALACHQYSDRGDKVFLGLNCAAMPDEVVESELYGHAAGAYPNALEGKKGFFEQANEGTVFLDGIDEMSFRMQTKLLRFINDGSFRRVGDDNEVYVDVRVICATKVDLYSLVQQKKFREDLYYRLNVLSLNIPPLRERKEDLMPLVDFFVTEFANKKGINKPTIQPELVNKLLNYDWLGNVRELKNLIYSSLAQIENNQLLAEDVILPNQANNAKTTLSDIQINDKQNLDEMMKAFEKNILQQLYSNYPSSRKLANRLGISHTAIANKLRDYGIGK